MITPIPSGTNIAATPTRKSDPVKEIEESIHGLEQMRDLMTHMGNARKAQEITRAIDVRRHQMELARQPERVFSAQCLAEIKGFLDDRAPLSAAFPDDLRQPIEHFRKLTDNGLAFSDASWKDLSPADAFVQLERKAYQAPSEQVMYRTMEGGMIHLSTLRPEYVHGLSFYVEHTREGRVFYKKDGENYDVINDPAAFLAAYKESPESALVHAADGAYVTLKEAPMRDIEWAKRMAQIDVRPENRPQVKDMGDTVCIGGIVLKKRPANPPGQ